MAVIVHAIFIYTCVVRRRDLVASDVTPEKVIGESL